MLSIFLELEEGGLPGLHIPGRRSGVAWETKVWLSVAQYGSCAVETICCCILRIERAWIERDHVNTSQINFSHVVLRLAYFAQVTIVINYKLGVKNPFRPCPKVPAMNADIYRARSEGR